MKERGREGGRRRKLYYGTGRRRSVGRREKEEMILWSGEGGNLDGWLFMSS